MATRRWSIRPGEGSVTITVAAGAATATKPIELTVDMAVGVKKGEVMKALEYISDYIKKSDF